MMGLSRQVVCLDWDRQKLRMLLARIGSGRITLDEAHAHRIPPKVEPDDPEAMGKYIAQMMARHRWTQKRAVMNVARERVVINALTLPPTTLDDLASVVRFQALKELPFSIDDAAVDFAVTGREGKNAVTQVLLAAVRKDVLDRISETATAAGLTLLRVGLRPWANLLGVVHAHAGGEKRVLFLDVGPTTTEIDVLRGGTLLFSRSPTVVVPPLTAPDDLAGEDSRISSKGEQDEVEVSEAGRDEAVEALMVELTRSLQACRAADPNAAVDEIVVAGGTGLEPLVAEAAASRFEVPVRLYDPGRALGLEESESAKLRSFAAALGLAWGLCRDGSLEIDFLHPKRPLPPRHSLKRRIRTGVLATATVVLVVAALGISRYQSLRRELDGINDDISRLVKDVKAKIELANAAEEVDDWAHEGVWLDHMLNLSDAAIDPREKMRAARVTFNQQTASVTLRLLCADMETAGQFVSKINAIHDAEGKARLYRAWQSAWRPFPLAEESFKGSVEMSVLLLDLEQRRAAAEKRAKDRKARVRDVLKTAQELAGV